MADKYKIDDSRLCCMVDTARWVMKFFREERMRGVRALAGSRYSNNASSKKVFVNLISLFCKIVGRSLFTNNPRVMLSTFDRGQKAAVAAAETWMNQELVRQDFAGEMKRLVMDGLFNIGIGYVALATPEDAAQSGWLEQAGKPLFTRIDLDDYVFDYRARDFRGMQFEGHRFRAILDMAKDNPRFNKKARERLQPSNNIAYDRHGEERIGNIGRGDETYYEDLQEMTELWQIYTPHDRMIRTYAESDLTGAGSAWEGGKPVALEEKRWIGHERGPYPKLAFEILPGNIFPKGPILDLLDLHDVANEGYRKLVRQAARLKKLNLYGRANAADADEMRKSNDGDWVAMQDPNSVKEMTQGGADAGLLQIILEFVKRFMEQGGNLMTMGGLAPQAGTLGQENLLAEQSNGQVAAMQDTTVSFVSDCCDRMLWYFWHDPRNVMEAPVQDQGLPDVNHVRKVHPWDHQNPNDLRRSGKKPELKIDPYSMRHTTPQQRIKDILSVVQGVFMPMAQLFAQQGKQLDLEALLEILGKNMDLPELASIITLGDVQAEPDGNSDPDQGSTAPPQQTEHIRRDTGPTQRAEEMHKDNQISKMAAAQKNGQANHGY